MDNDELAAAMARLAELRKRYDRDHLPFAVHAICLDAFSADGVRRLADLGVTHAVGGFGSFNPYGMAPDTETLQEKIDAFNRYADRVIAQVADLAEEEAPT
jgi:hypothetical protein